MSLEERIENELKESMKKKDVVKLSTIRMLKAEINNVKLDKNKKSLDDGEVMKIVQKQVKQHKESIEHFKKGDRLDLVEKEEKELKILMGYLPEQLSDDKLKKMVEEAIRETGATEKKDMGKVMKAVMAKAKGQVDGKKVSQMVSGILK